MNIVMTFGSMDGQNFDGMISGRLLCSKETITTMSDDDGHETYRESEANQVEENCPLPSFLRIV
jgi:hypothetical protein